MMHAEQQQREIVVDSFAGGGGASTGIEMALGFSPDIAINHDAEAIAMHRRNHPESYHLVTNVWKVDPYAVAQGRPVGFLWASPDCKDFSKAKGGKPVRKHIRDLAWVVVGWARTVKPRIIMLENVEEFQDWGPLLADGTRCPNRKGMTFKKFIRELRRLGYKVEWRELVAAEYGSPTTRKRLFIIARRDGLPIVWPKPSHKAIPVGDRVLVSDIQVKDGGGNRLPFRTAASCIDWTLPCYSIFITNPQAKAMRKRSGVKIIRPLAKNTMARIARGVKRYVIEAEKPFIVPVTHTGDQRVNGTDEPHRTTTCAQRGEHALVQPFITKFNRGSTGSDMQNPMPTVMSAHSDTHPGGAPHMGIVSPLLVGVGSRAGQSPERSLDRPGPTTTATKRGQHAVVTAHLETMRNSDSPCSSAEDPARTATAGGAGLYVVEAGLINTRNGEREGQEPRVRDLQQPGPTTTAEGSQGGVAVAFVAQHNTERNGGVKAGRPVTVPLSTTTSTGGQQNVVLAHLAAHYGPGDGGQDRSASAEEPVRVIPCEPRHSVVEVETAGFLGQQNTDMVGRSAVEPVSTIVQKGCTQTVVEASLISMRGTDPSQMKPHSVEEPNLTASAGGIHTGVVEAFVQRYFGTDQDPRLEEPMGAQTTKNRTGVVEVRSDIPPLTPEQHTRALQVAKFLRKFGCWDGGELVTTKTGAVIVDIGMRMLIPRELFRAQGFPDTYIIDHGITETGEIVPLTKTAQIRLVGNSVCPQVACALVKANYKPLDIVRDAPAPLRLVGQR